MHPFSTGFAHWLMSTNLSWWPTTTGFMCLFIRTSKRPTNQKMKRLEMLVPTGFDLVTNSNANYLLLHSAIRTRNEFNNRLDMFDFDICLNLTFCFPLPGIEQCHFALRTRMGLMYRCADQLQCNKINNNCDWLQNGFQKRIWMGGLPSSAPPTFCWPGLGREGVGLVRWPRAQPLDAKQVEYLERQTTGAHRADSRQTDEEGRAHAVHNVTALFH